MHGTGHLRWTLLALCFIALGALSVSTPVTTVSAQDDFKSLKKEYDTAKRDGARSAMGRIVEKMAGTNEKDAAKFLVSELDTDQKLRKRGRAGLPGDVRDKIIASLAKFTDEESVELIGGMALGMKSDKEPVLALDQFDFFKALAGMKDVEAADNTLRTALADAKNPYIKCAALEAIRQTGAKRFTDDVVQILYEDNKEWAQKWLIVPINTFTCLRDIVDADDKPSVIKVVEAVVAWEERKVCLDERVRYFGGQMLAELTGEAADMASVFFWKWWVQQMKAVGAIDRSSKPNEKRSKTAPVPPVFDTSPVGKRFVFVIDCSDSMKLPLKIDLPEIERRRKDRGPVSGKRKKEGIDEEEEKEDDNPLRRLPWKEISIKMDLARHELSRAVKEFVGDRYFAIVVYGTGYECITDGWVQATDANCRKWSKEALELDFMGMTNIHGALMQSLKISDKSTSCEHPSVDPNCVLTGADTIVFMTDGWGSWDDYSTNRVTDKRNKQENAIGDGQFIYGEDIWPEVLRHNIFRKVIISCVGIGNHDKDLLRNLARQTGGTYVDWGFPEE
jgi:hypothetical protein